MATFYQPKTNENSIQMDSVQASNVLNGFLIKYSTTHGIRSFGKSRGSCKKLLWLSLLLSGTVMMGIQLYLITNTYLAYQVRTVGEKITVQSLNFPAITVCNTNPIKSSMLLLDARLHALVNNWKALADSSTRKKRDIAVVDNAKAFDNLNNGNRQDGVKTESVLGTIGTGELNKVEPHMNCKYKESHTNNEFNHISLANNSLKEKSTVNNNFNEYNDFNKESPRNNYLNKESQRTSAHGQQRIKRSALYQCVTLAVYGKHCIVKMYRDAEDAVQTCATILTDAINDGYPYRIASLETYEERRALLDDGTVFTGLITDDFYHIGLTWNGTHLNWYSGVQHQPFKGDFLYTYVRGNETYTKAKIHFYTDVVYDHSWVGADATDRGTVLCEKYVDETTTQTIPTTTAETTNYETILTTMAETTNYETLPTTTAETTNYDVTTTLSTLPHSTTLASTSSYQEREPLREDFKQETDILETIADIPDDTKSSMGYQYDEFVISCQYQDTECDESKFGQFFDAIHGNCYVFNSDWVKNTDAVVNKPGINHGLTMTFNLGQQEYIEGVSETAGVIVVVHARDKMPFPEEEGVFATPGHLTSIGLSQISIQRLGGKYSDCKTELNDLHNNVFAEKYNISYSVVACYKTCYQKYVIQRCGCSDPQYPNQGVAFGDVTVPICNVRNLTQDDCVYGVNVDYISDTLPCDCLNPCKETTFRYSVSKVAWPQEKYLNSFIDENSIKMQSTLNYSTDTAYLRRNVVKIKVHFNELNYQNMYEKAKYPASMYLADVASVIGLWLGMSLMSIIEFIEVVMDLVFIMCCKKNNKQKKPESFDKQSNTVVNRSTVNISVKAKATQPSLNADLKMRHLLTSGDNNKIMPQEKVKRNTKLTAWDGYHRIGPVKQVQW